MKFSPLFLILSPFLVEPVLSIGFIQFIQERYITGAGGNIFGDSAAVSGNNILVGAPGSGFNSAHGVVFAYKYNDSNFSQTLTGSATTSSASFGAAISIDGNVAVIGATKQYLDRGAAYVFQETGMNWTETQLLTPNLYTYRGAFGSAVAIQGNTVVIGAPGASDPPNGNQNRNTGAAYVFVRSASSGSFSETQKLVASDKASGDYFGTSVSIDGNTIVVGASQKRVNGVSYAGAVYVFERPNSTASFVQTQRLTISGVFVVGKSVSISGNTMAVGVSDSSVVKNGGAIYIFERTSSNFASTQKLALTVAEARLGSKVRVSGNRVVGAADNEPSSLGLRTGALYIFEKNPSNVWNLKQRIQGTKGGQLLGRGLGFDGVTLVAGGTQNGEVFFYRGRNVTTKSPTTRSPTTTMPPTTTSPTTATTTTTGATTTSVTQGSSSPSMIPTALPSSSSPTIPMPSSAPATSKPSSSPVTAMPSTAPTKLRKIGTTVSVAIRQDTIGWVCLMVAFVMIVGF